MPRKKTERKFHHIWMDTNLRYSLSFANLRDSGFSRSTSWSSPSSDDISETKSTLGFESASSFLALRRVGVRMPLAFVYFAFEGDLAKALSSVSD